MRASRRAALLRAGVDVSKVAISYTGSMTDEVVSMSGVAYRLLTLTSSGTLSVGAELHGDVCVCSGGQGGSAASSWQVGTGGAGGFMLNYYGVAVGLSQVATVGGGGQRALAEGAQYNGGASAFDGLSSGNAFAKNGMGGTGGGSPLFDTSSTYSQGDGLSKHPFGDTVFFPDPHCGGGGSGAYHERNDTAVHVVKRTGGAGGTNGGNGGLVTSLAYNAPSTDMVGGEGGVKGGGVGSGWNGVSVAAATYYGSGGGGGRLRIWEDGQIDRGYSAAGYQGVIYVRIPLKQ